jgi:hypothetical protein
MITARYLDPTARTFDQTVFGWLLEELPTARRFWLASGYVDAAILDWLEAPILALRERGGSASAIVGSNGGQTSAEDVERLLGLFDEDLFIDYAEGGIFHPKIYALEHPDRIQAAIGSANFTVRGAIANVEAGLVIETNVVGPPAEEPLAAIINSLNPEKYPHATQISSTEDIGRLEKIGVLGRAVRQESVTVKNDDDASRQRRARTANGFGQRGIVMGIPARNWQYAPRPAPQAHPKPEAADSHLYCGFVFSKNDLKNTGTREVSVSSGIRSWAAGILGRPIEVGEGTLFEIDIEARLSASPGSIFVTLDPVRLWSAGASGGTHQDVRLVLGTHLKGGLDDESVLITGRPVAPGSIGVFELPADPRKEPVRLTIVLADDDQFSELEARLRKVGREQKLNFSSHERPSLPIWQ